MNRLKELRYEKKWTQKHLGSLLHVRNTTISKFETGRASLTDIIIIKAAQLFDVTSDYLLGITLTRTNTELELPVNEKKILFYFNRLDEEYKDSVKGYMVDLYREQQNVFTEALKKRAS
jgi:transcriptional regulator with XRE-family HTH domain